MSHLGTLEVGSRHDLRVGKSPDAPDDSDALNETSGTYGYVHSYETSSRYDGPGVRAVLFVSGCLLRCTYCHNPDTWHLKDGTYIASKQVLDRLESFASALRSLDGGLTISGGEPMVQMAFTGEILAGAKALGLHTAIETSGYLGDRVDDNFLSNLDLALLDIKSSNPETYKKVTGRDLAPTLRFAKRLAEIGKPTWVRFTLVPGHTDDPENVEGIARFAASLTNVKWVEVQPFHQLGAFKWRAMGLPYVHENTATPTPDLIARVINQFRATGCNVR